MSRKPWKCRLFGCKLDHDCETHLSRFHSDAVSRFCIILTVKCARKNCSRLHYKSIWFTETLSDLINENLPVFIAEQQGKNQ